MLCICICCVYSPTTSDNCTCHAYLYIRKFHFCTRNEISKPRFRFDKMPGICYWVCEFVFIFGEGLDKSIYGWETTTHWNVSCKYGIYIYISSLGLKTRFVFASIFGCAKPERWKKISWIELILPLLSNIMIKVMMKKCDQFQRSRKTFRRISRTNEKSIWKKTS